MKRRRNQEDDEDSGYQDALDEIESGDAYVISDAGRLGSEYEVNKLSGRFPDFSDAIRAIARDMETGRYWPGVYYVNDHGNIDVIALRIGKRRVTWKTVASYV